MSLSVCHVVGGVVGGGVEQVVINYCSKMQNIHFDLLYQYDPDPVCLCKLNNAGVNCFRIPEKTKHPFKHFYSLYSYFKRGKYDAVHTHLDWFLNWTVCFCAMCAGIKKRISHHHHVYREKTFFHKILYFLLQWINRLFATHYLACSHSAAVNGWGRDFVKSGRVLVLNNAVDLDCFKFSSLDRKRIRKLLNINDEICIGHVGRFCYQKNQYFLLNFFKLFRKRKEHSVLLLIGDGPDKTKIIKLAESIGIAEAIRFVNPQKNVAPYYSAMDIFCLPSRWEGLGMVLIEAQVNGLPCVASSGVPKSAMISSDFCFLPIDSEWQWCEAILNRVNFNHDNWANADEYDIKTNYIKLEKLYME